MAKNTSAWLISVIALAPCLELWSLCLVCTGYTGTFRLVKPLVQAACWEFLQQSATNSKAAIKRHRADLLYAEFWFHVMHNCSCYMVYAVERGTFRLVKSTSCLTSMSVIACFVWGICNGCLSLPASWTAWVPHTEPCHQAVGQGQVSWHMHCLWLQSCPWGSLLSRAIDTPNPNLQASKG